MFPYLWSIANEMTSSEQKRKNNREAQTRYRQRKKMRQARLKDEVRQATSRVEHLRQILKQRTRKESSRPPEDIVLPTIDKDQHCTTASSLDCPESLRDLTDASQEPIAPGSFGFHDLSPLFSPHAAQSNFDVLVDWEKIGTDVLDAKEDFAYKSGTELLLDGLKPDSNVQEDSGAAHCIQTLASEPSLEYQPRMDMELNDKLYGLTVEGNPQDSDAHALRDGSGLSLPHSEDMNLDTQPPGCSSHLASTSPAYSTGMGLAIWPRTHPSVLTYGSCQTAVQQVLYALQSMMLVANVPTGFGISNNHFYYSDSHIKPLMGAHPM